MSYDRRSPPGGAVFPRFSVLSERMVSMVYMVEREVI
jgi:hypothetical protein